jgi:hypothetical protein
MQAPSLWQIISQTNQHIWLATFLLFIAIVTADLWANLYEQYFIIQEAGRSFFLLRSTEIILFMFLTLFGCGTSLLATFIAIVCIKVACLALIMIYAYKRWHILPSGAVNIKVAVVTLVINGLFLFFTIQP